MVTPWVKKARDIVRGDNIVYPALGIVAVSNDFKSGELVGMQYIAFDHWTDTTGNNWRIFDGNFEFEVETPYGFEVGAL